MNWFEKKQIIEIIAKLKQKWCGHWGYQIDSDTLGIPKDQIGELLESRRVRSAWGSGVRRALE